MDERELLREIKEYAQELSHAADEHSHSYENVDDIGALAHVASPGRLPRSALVVVVVATLLAASATAAVVSVNRSSKPRRVPPMSTSPRTELGDANPAQLSAGSWSLIPKAPIPVDRGGGSLVWTGHELITWGGARGPHGDQLRADGAAYNPSTRTWRMLPPSPLSARAGQSSVWTGSELIVWGGEDNATEGNVHTVADGAAYSPSTNRWTMLSTAPLSARVDAVAVWTGSRMVVLGGGTDVSHNTDVDGAAYDPVRDRWQHIEPPIAPHGDPVTWRLAVPIGGSSVLAWSVWIKGLAAATSPSSEVTSGTDMFTYDATTNEWTNVEKAPGAFEDPKEALWTGKYALVRGQIAPNCVLCHGPGPDSEATSRYDPTTNRWTALAADPLETPLLISAWTGGAMFSYDPDSLRGPIKPGDATVYDPAADSWTQLARAPQTCGAGAVPVWTDGQVLMFCTDGPEASGGTSSGLAYTPGNGSPSTTARATATTTPSAATPVALPALDQIPHAVPLYERRFPWGRGPGSVGGEPGHQSAPVGPLAFTADRDGNIVIFDVVNGRLVERLGGRAATFAVDTRGFGPDPAVLDTEHRLIASDGTGGLVVFGADGALLRHFPPRDFPVAAGSFSLVTDGSDVFADSDNNSRILLLHDDGTGYQPTPSAKWAPDRVSVQVGFGTQDATIGRADGSRYSLRAPWHIAALLANRLRPDGTIVAVAVVDAPSNAVPNVPASYYHVLIAIDRHGHATLQQFPAPSSYMDTGPIFELTDTYLGVMSDTARDGVTIAVYPYPDTPGQ